jgi:hypothetical protein
MNPVTQAPQLLDSLLGTGYYRNIHTKEKTTKADGYGPQHKSLVHK